MRNLFSPKRSEAPRAPASAATLPQLRATLDGLEVSDSSWDEWVAADLARSQQRGEQVQQLHEAGEGPLRRLQRAAVKAQ